ncbi:MAG TPA: hypothetical protein VKC56_05710 [Gallionellaceae bacterium]|nr:hypothetical protein [Gallionellaceae bacterium]
MDYPWLPLWARDSFRHMEEAGNLSDQERKLFTDDRLEDFWRAADKYVSERLGNGDDELGGWLIGSIIAPLQLHGGPIPAGRLSKKTEIRQRQKNADALLDEAADLASDLVRKLWELEKSTNLRPHPLDGYLNTIRDLETELREYPKTQELFQDVHGMASQKSSWRDWMREADHNLQTMRRVRPGDLRMREKHWVALAQVLFGGHISRDAVKAALTSVNG